MSHYNISERGNGFSISINTGKTFDEDLIAIWITDNNWLSLSVPGGTIDSSAIHDIVIKYPIDEVKTVQMENAVQISFLLSVIPDDFELSSSDNKLIINIYTAQKEIFS